MVFLLIGAFLVGAGVGALVVLGIIERRVTALERKQTLLSSRIDSAVDLIMSKRITLFVEKSKVWREEDRVLGKKVSELEGLVRALLSGDALRRAGVGSRMRDQPSRYSTHGHPDLDDFDTDEYERAVIDTFAHPTPHTLRECCESYSSLAGARTRSDDCPSWSVLSQLCNSLWASDKMRSFYRGVQGSELHSGHAQPESGGESEGVGLSGGAVEPPGQNTDL